MKKVMALFFVALSLVMSGCSQVPSGNVGVKVFLLGGEKGVDTQVLTTGRYWIGMNEELYIFPTFTQNEVWAAPKDKAEANQSLSFQSVEGMEVNADVGLSYRINPEDVPVVFQKYRKGIEEISDIALRNIVRDELVTSASTRTVEDIYGAGKKAFMDEVETNIRAKAKTVGITVEDVSLIGSMRLPPQVLAALNAKIASTQKAQQRENEVAQSKAEADKKIEEARGIAESMKLTNTEVTDKVLRLRELEVQQQWVEKWNGSLPSTVMGDAVPMVNIK